MGPIVTPPASTRQTIAPGEATPGAQTSVKYAHDEIRISLSAVLWALNGLAMLPKPADGEVDLIERAITTSLSSQTLIESINTLSFPDWQALIGNLALEKIQRQRIDLAVAIAFLCQSSRSKIKPSAVDPDLIWRSIYEALTRDSTSFPVSRSSQGFLAVPLLSIMKDGNIAELLRLHVWEANDLRGTPELAIHSHQPFIQSWILAGEGRDHTYEVHPAEPGSADSTIFAEYELHWTSNDTRESGRSYHTNSKSSTIVNRGNFVRAVEERSELHTTGMTYCIPSNGFHRSEVAPGTFHATLAFFDSSQGFSRDAPVLGPWNGTSFTAKKDPAGVSANDLAKMVNSVRAWEAFYSLGMQHLAKAELEEAIRSLRKAFHLCESDTHLPIPAHYKTIAILKLGHTYRMLGRNELASSILEDAHRDLPQNKLRMQISGELAVVYRHMNRLDDAKKACEDEYNTALVLGLDRAICRAIGTLGMINYQLSLARDPSLITTAIEQLTERVDRARKLRAFAMEQLNDADARVELIESASMREAIGLGRLSLCYQRQGDAERAVNVAREGLEVQSTTRDLNCIGFARGLYGLALLNADRHEKALQQFNPRDGCSPVICMVKEPSDEHRGYIRKMIDAGADLDLRDEQGYSALECAVYNGDAQTQLIIEEGLRRRYLQEAEEKLKRQRYEAELRKGYRNIFQDKLRPVLLRSGSKDVVQHLRAMYALTLHLEEENARMFDCLRYVHYTDFVEMGRLPRASDGVTRQMNVEDTDKESSRFIVFISYRWLAKAAADNASDDAHGTQYKRMKRALREFLALHPEVDPVNLGIWVDVACVNQSDYEHQQRGVAALLMSLAQCDAMISLTDDRYYERAWCCLEVLMIQTLKHAYGRHIWYQHAIDQSGQVESLQPGPSPSEMEIDLSQKKVTYEADRSKLLFLERQTRLIS
ncbi:hypothetical protein F5Y08DRAFT_125827 [Xylaria arbuscula]|nr:hypothetical protein F5Y08DRAFT_125827 [Xylaria arbuscula]